MSTRFTPKDVETQKFNVKLRGYDREEVRRFLGDVGEEIEHLILDNDDLRRECGRLRGDLEEIRDRERILQETLVSAQKMADQMKQRSRREAELLIQEARMKAERLLDQSQDQLAALESEIGRLRVERDAYENRLRGAIEEHLALLDMRRRERKAESGNLLFLGGRRSTTEAG